MKDNEILEIPIKGLLGQGLLKEIPRSKETMGIKTGNENKTGKFLT